MDKWVGPFDFVFSFVLSLFCCFGFVVFVYYFCLFVFSYSVCLCFLLLLLFVFASLFFDFLCFLFSLGGAVGWRQIGVLVCWNRTFQNSATAFLLASLSSHLKRECRLQTRTRPSVLGGSCWVRMETQRATCGFNLCSTFLKASRKPTKGIHPGTIRGSGAKHLNGNTSKTKKKEATRWKEVQSAPPARGGSPWHRGRACRPERRTLPQLRIEPRGVW